MTNAARRILNEAWQAPATPSWHTRWMWARKIEIEIGSPSKLKWRNALRVDALVQGTDLFWRWVLFFGGRTTLPEPLLTVPQILYRLTDLSPGSSSACAPQVYPPSPAGHSDLRCHELVVDPRKGTGPATCPNLHHPSCRWSSAPGCKLTPHGKLELLSAEFQWPQRLVPKMPQSPLKGR